MTPVGPSETLHGVLVNVAGTGVVITGESGLGKSSCALELISRGHRLVSDDVIVVETLDDRLIGSVPDRLDGLLHVRGLGIVDVRELFGPTAFMPRCTIDVCIEFTSGFTDFDPLAQEVFEFLGVNLRKFVVHSETGRSLPILVETAARLVISAGELR